MRPVLLVLIGALLLAGCGQAAGPPTQVVAAAPTTGSVPMSQSWPAVAVRRDADPRAVLIDLTGLPVPGQPDPCDVRVAPRADESATATVSVAVDVTVRAQAPFAECTTASRTVRVPLRRALGQRAVSVDGSAVVDLFLPRGQGFALCTQPSCDPGSVREPADCSTLRDAIARTDKPRGFWMSGPCAEPFAATVVDYGVGACPADDGGGRSRCAGKLVTRQFWVARHGTWRLVLEDRTGTCAGAHALDPAFPVSLCRDPTWLAAT